MTTSLLVTTAIFPGQQPIPSSRLPHAPQCPVYLLGGTVLGSSLLNHDCGLVVGV